MIARVPLAAQATVLADRQCGGGAGKFAPRTGRRRKLSLGGACARATLVEAENLGAGRYQAAAGRSFANVALQHGPQDNAQPEHHRGEPEPEHRPRSRPQGAAGVCQNGYPEQRRTARQQDAAPDAGRRAAVPRCTVTGHGALRAWWKSSRMRLASHTRISVQRNGGTCLAGANADHEEPISNSLRKNWPGNRFRASSPRPAFRRVNWAACQIDAMHQSPSLQQQA